MADTEPTRIDNLPYRVFASGLCGRVAGLFRCLVPISSGGNRKRDLIQIQWFVTIACSYLLLFEKDKITYDPVNLLLLIAPLGCILIFLRLPETAFTHKSFPHAMALADTILLSTAIIVNRQSPWDLVLVFFFGIFIAAIGENLLQIVLGCLGLSIVSVVIAPLSGKGDIDFDSGTLLRIPLLFGASLVYGYLSDEVKQEKRKTAHLEESRRQQLGMKDQFLSHVSHELRTPLTAVYQFVTILADGIAGDLNEEQREYIGIILRNLKQLQAMVGDLLDATRADSGKLAIDPQVILLQSFVSQTLTMLTPGAAVKGVTLSAEISDDLPFVYGDPQRVNQILTNLIDNGLKFTAAKGKITVRAEVFERDPAWLHISVTDTGCGISPEGTQKIFDRLYQEGRTLDSNRKGLGLGLHICKELVSRHGGRIWVDSKIGAGSTFHFTLPVYSLTTLLVPLVKARDRRDSFLELISVELRVEKLPPTSEPAKAAWRAAWNSLNQLTGGRSGTVLLPRMATSEEQGLLFLVTAGGLDIDEIRSAASKGVADCAAVRHSTCRITATATVSDFTDDRRSSVEKRAAEAATKILKAIAQISAEKSNAITARLDFLGEMSREVRTPVTVVMGYASILRDKLLGDLTPEQEHVVTKVLTEINDLMLMVSNIFEAERIDSPAQQPASHEINLGVLLQELRSIHNVHPNESANIVWNYPADLPVVISDGDKLRLILQNIIHETLKFCAGAQVTITTRYCRQTQILEFAVATTGISVHERGVRAVFRHAHRESPAAGASLSGNNWGVYIVNTCTKLLGGTITFEDDGEEKSTVIVKFPVKEALPESTISGRIAAARGG